MVRRRRSQHAAMLLALQPPVPRLAVIYTHASEVCECVVGCVRVLVCVCVCMCVCVCVFRERPHAEFWLELLLLIFLSTSILFLTNHTFLLFRRKKGRHISLSRLPSPPHLSLSLRLPNTLAHCLPPSLSVSAKLSHSLSPPLSLSLSLSAYLSLSISVCLSINLSLRLTLSPSLFSYLCLLPSLIPVYQSTTVEGLCVYLC